MKQVIRLTESDLHRVIKESVKRVLRENEQFSNLAEIDSYVAQNQGVNSQELACVVADCMHDNQIPFNSIYQCKNLMQCVDPNAVKMELRKLVQRNIEQTRQQRDLWKTNQEY